MLTVRVPATIANMGPGFDSFGMAISLYNRFTFERAEQDALIFSAESSTDTSGLSNESADNILFSAMDQLYRKHNQTRPSFKITVQADIPVARGLGSSSTAIVAGLLAANQLLGEPSESLELLALATTLEGHPDNVAPAMLGGIVLCDTQHYSLPWPLEWRIMVISPAYTVKTDAARRILPGTVPMEDAVFNLRKAATLTYALLREEPDALRASLQDRLHQPYRRKLIPEYDAIEKLVMDDGAFGMIISGSGSTMAVLYPTVIHAFLLEKLEDLIRVNQWEMVINDVTVDMEGARLLSA